MTTADEALQIVLDNVAPLGIERCSITEALGRILAEDIHSPRAQRHAQPDFKRALHHYIRKQAI